MCSAYLPGLRDKHHTLAVTITLFLSIGMPSATTEPHRQLFKSYLSFKVQLKFYFLHDCSLEARSLKCILLPPSSLCRNLYLFAHVLPLKPFVNGSVLSSSVSSHIHTIQLGHSHTRLLNKNICDTNDKELKVLLCPPNLGLLFYLQQKKGGREALLPVCKWRD